MAMTWRDWFKSDDGRTLATVDMESRTVTNVDSGDADDDITWRAAWFYFEKLAEFTNMGTALYKDEYEKWMPRRTELLNRHDAGSLKAMKMEAFYDALQASYSTHRAGVYALLEGERIDGVVPLSQREATKAGLAEGGGYRGKQVMA